MMTTVDHGGFRVAVPGDDAFDAATRVFNLAAPATPDAAVTACTVDDVKAAIAHARSAHLRVRVHATGHAAPTAHPMANGLLIRTTLRGGVTVDPRRRVARVPAGTLWGDVVAAAADYGLAAPHGSSSTVGVVGYLLRGGMSFYGRWTGLAVNSVRAIELVTADGVLRRVDATTDPELFWALRGGGGGFGVVTAVEVALFPAGRVCTGAAFWPVRHAEQLLWRWRVWTVDAPREATTSLQILTLPPLPEIPPELTDGPVLCVDGAVLGTPGTDPRREADDLLSRLRAVAPPLLDTWQETEPAAVLHAHMDPEDPVAIVGDHMMLDEISDDGAAAFLGAVGDGSGSPLISASLRQLGGAFARSDPAGGVLDHLDGRYAYSGAGVATDPDTAAAITHHCEKVRVALRPWDTGRTVPSFVENREQPQGHLGAEQVHAVDRVRARVDPTGLFSDDIAPGCYDAAAQNRPGLPPRCH